MWAFIDAAYSAAGAYGAMVLAKDWRDGVAHNTVTADLGGVAAYESNQFYKRELPIIEELLQKALFRLEAIVIDGYCYGRNGSQRLGTYVFHAYGGRTPVIGIAKTALYEATDVFRVYRGKSQNPLYVTAVQMPGDVAATYVREMHGDNRLPTLVKLADRTCRQARSVATATAGLKAAAAAVAR
jgi:deoxyribonuclease V